MKKLFTFLFAATFIISLLQTAKAQSVEPIDLSALYPEADFYPGLTPSEVSSIGSDKATWDILFNYNTTFAGYAGVAVVNNSIWASKWASDTIAEFTTAGVFVSKFQIAGLTGVRSFTFDGTNLYAGTNTTTIYRIDPVTKQLNPPHITVGANARWITFDPTLNSGAGGFWYGNYATDITAVSLTGTVLTSIPAATHGLTGMYGAAIDNSSLSGPYLWVFDQSGTNTCQVKAISMPSGTLTTYDHDAFTDVGSAMSLTGGLAGGLFLSTTISSGNIALVGLMQGTPTNLIFAYDLDIPLGINTHNNNFKFEVYPNPVKNFVTVLLPNNCPQSSIKIIETSGRVADEFNVNANMEKLQIDLSNYPAGFYFVKVDNANFTETQKIIVTK